MSESRFDFLKDLVATVPDVQGEEDLADTPTPRSSSSNQAFQFPNPSVPGTSSSSHRNPASSALGAPPSQEEDEDQESEDDEDDDDEQESEPPKIAGMYTSCVTQPNITSLLIDL